MMQQPHLYSLSLRYFLVVCVLVLAAFFSPSLTHEATANQGITGMQFGQGFRCAGGSASGELYTAAGCSGDPSQGQVFSYFVCKFEEIIRKALGDVYCSIVEEAKPGVMAALTMAVLFMGMMFLMGMSPFTAKELMIFAAKFSLVLAFATEAEYMIGIGYALFMNVAKEGIVIVLSYLFEGSYQNAGDVYRLFDDGLKQIMQLSSADSKKEGGQCQNTLFSMMVLVAAALPPLAFVGAYFMIKLVWVMLRAVFGYCQGILGVTFLVTLAPIYVSFALFKPTRSLFDKWVQYLISFSFQMVIVFAFLGMAFNIIKKMSDDIQSYTQLVKPYNRDFRAPGMANVFKMCGICELDKVAPKEKPKCKSNRVMEIGELSKNENFLHFASVKVLGMVIMFYILDIMMDFVPQMARHLAGQKYAGQLGGGSTGGTDEVDMSMPGEKKIKEAINAGAKAFLSSGNSASGFVRGFGAFGSQFAKGLTEEATRVGVGAAAAAGLYGLLRGSSAGQGGGGFTRTSQATGGGGSDGDGGGPSPQPTQRDAQTVPRTTFRDSYTRSASDDGGGGDAAAARAERLNQVRSGVSSTALQGADQARAALMALRGSVTKTMKQDGTEETTTTAAASSEEMARAIENSLSHLSAEDQAAALSYLLLAGDLSSDQEEAVRTAYSRAGSGSTFGGGTGGPTMTT